jgi:uncharacterized protein YndB with AHSA1/START domain
MTYGNAAMTWPANHGSQAGPIRIPVPRTGPFEEFWSRALDRLRRLAQQEEETNRTMTQTAEPPVMVKEIRIKASPATVHSFLTDGDKLVRWMGHEATLEARPGGPIEINYNGFDIMRGEYIEISANRVVMSWGWEDNPLLGPGESTVTFELEPDGSDTLLRLTHTGLPMEMQPSFSEGWDHFMGRLAVVAEGREPGPNPWAPRQAELAAGRLRKLMREARATVAAAPETALQRKSAAEGWTGAALAMHIVGHLGLVVLVEECVTGKSEFLGEATLDAIDQQNLQTTAANTNASKTSILGAFDAEVDGAVERLRGINDEDFAKGMAVKFTPSGHITAAETAAGPLLANVTEHVASLKATLG